MIRNRRLTITEKKILIQDIKNIKNNHPQKDFIQFILQRAKQALINHEAYLACADLKAMEDKYGIDIPFTVPSSR